MSREERRCREQDCNWWCACCNKWFCWLVSVLLKVIVWVIVTVVKWVVTLVCHIVTIVIGIVVELVLKVIHRVITFLVCLFTDPLQALKTLWDLWNDIVDTVEDIFDLVITLLDDIKGIIHDIGKLVDSLGRSFCIFGKAACAFFGAIFGFIKGIIDWVEDIVDWVRDTIDGIKELIAGILTLNWCRIQAGLGIFNVLRVITSITRIPAGWFYTGPANLINDATLEKIVNDALVTAFDGDAERLDRSKKLARLGGYPIGVPITIDARRIGIRSTEFLRELHKSGILNLHAIAGRVSDCQGKFVSSAFTGEVVYTGTSTTVSQSDLDDFISGGPKTVPSFTVYPIKLPTFRRYLEMARKKGFQIGLNFTWSDIKEIVINTARFVPLQSDDEALGTDAQQELLSLMGRPNTGEDLSIVPAIAIFGYTKTSLNGLTAWFRPALEDGSPSGITFRTRFPEVGFRFVPIHEIGHYYGLNHEGHDNASLIMWSPQSEDKHIPAALPEFLFLSGEANFNEDDAINTWNWITMTEQAKNTILP
ncbi:MAG: hypothetical protein ABI691_17895 [Ginsengibacter sp.]